MQDKCYFASRKSPLRVEKTERRYYSNSDEKTERRYYSNSDVLKKYKKKQIAKNKDIFQFKI